MEGTVAGYCNVPEKEKKKKKKERKKKNQSGGKVWFLRVLSQSIFDAW